jgi:hypothetical protein
VPSITLYGSGMSPDFTDGKAELSRPPPDFDCLPDFRVPFIDDPVPKVAHGDVRHALNRACHTIYMHAPLAQFLL